MNNKHLTLDDRNTIKYMLDSRKPFCIIAHAINKAPSTVSREVRAHLQFKRVGGMNLAYNSCVHHNTCTKRNICPQCVARRHYSLCRRCFMCNSFCSSFELYVCPNLCKPPYVCNGCGNRSSCSLEKRFYNPDFAHSEYSSLLSESRSGISYSEEDIRYIDSLISPLILKGQSPHHICTTIADSVPVSERTIYRLIDSRILSARNIDLARKVRFSARKAPVHHKVDKTCRIGRSFDDFKAFQEREPDIPIVQMDSVEGRKGGKVLLTIHFVKAEFMLAYLRDHNDSRSVIDIFNRLDLILGSVSFSRIFRVILTDYAEENTMPKKRLIA